MVMLTRPLSPLLLLISFQALSMAEVNEPGPQAAEPQIAMFCGRQILHMNLESSQWEPDPQGRQGCFTEPSQILSYCQEVQIHACEMPVHNNSTVQTEAYLLLYTMFFSCHSLCHSTIANALKKHSPTVGLCNTLHTLHFYQISSMTCTTIS